MIDCTFIIVSVIASKVWVAAIKIIINLELLYYLWFYCCRVCFHCHCEQINKEIINYLCFMIWYVKEQYVIGYNFKAMFCYSVWPDHQLGEFIAELHNLWFTLDMMVPFCSNNTSIRFTSSMIFHLNISSTPTSNKIYIDDANANDYISYKVLPLKFVLCIKYVISFSGICSL